MKFATAHVSRGLLLVAAIAAATAFALERTADAQGQEYYASTYAWVEKYDPADGTTTVEVLNEGPYDLATAVTRMQHIAVHGWRDGYVVYPARSILRVEVMLASTVPGHARRLPRPRPAEPR